MSKHEYVDDDTEEAAECQDQMSDASEEDFAVWAEWCDNLNGAPESEEDR